MPTNAATSHVMASMAGIFRGSLTFKWGPNDDEPLLVANKINTIDFRLRNFELPMVAAREIVIDDKNARFDSETDPNNKPWKKRAKGTIDYYKQHGITYQGILETSSDLRNAVTKRESYPVVDNDMFIDTSGWPVYWHAHDQGSVVGRGQKLPKREFVGVSVGAQFEIIDIFDQYLNDTLDIIPAGKSGVPMYRGALGRIAGPVTSGMQHPRIAPIVPGITAKGTSLGLP